MTVSDEMIERADGWLIVKRDLYFRPDCKGYTGIRDEAGRYSYEFAKGYEREGVSLVHESKAPEFRAAAFDDLVIKHLIKQRDEARAALTAALESGAWQPIETAPKDGTEVLVFCDKEQFVCFWNGEHWQFASVLVGADHHYMACVPTEWQPLPAPPVTRHNRATPDAPDASALAQQPPEQSPSGLHPPGERP